MQYTVTINQLAAVTHFPELDLKDVAIIDFIRHFTISKAAKKHRRQLDGEDYFWLKYSKLIHEMPLLKISNERAMKRRIDKMVSIGILLRHPDCIGLKKSYFALSEKSELIYTKEVQPTPKSTGLEENDSTPESTGSEEITIHPKVQAQPTPKSTGNHYTLSNPSTLFNQDTNYSANADVLGGDSFFEGAKKEKKVKTPKSEPAAGGGAAAGVKPQKRKSKWGEGIFREAENIFDKCYADWAVRKKGMERGKVTGIFWTPIERGQLSNLLKAVIYQANTQQGREVSEREAVEKYFPDFLGKVARLDEWYMDSFTPTSIYRRINQIITDISKRAVSQNGYRPEIIDSSKYAQYEAMAKQAVMAQKYNA